MVQSDAQARPQRAHRRRRLLLRVFLALVVLVLIGAGGGYTWLRGALPQQTGKVTVQGSTAPIMIERDPDGVPHIRASSANDALFGLGYAHAQDRLWQMEFQRRIGNGRLSEILGEATVSTDRFLRTLGVARAAHSAWLHTSVPARAALEAYVAGVNAFISTHHGRTLPIEFTILGFEPKPWSPEDVLVWGKMMAWDLGGNWEVELLRARLIGRVGEDGAAALLPDYPAGAPLIMPDGMTTAAHAANSGTAQADSTLAADVPARTGDALAAINQSLIQELGLGGVEIGSNNWVIAGSRTTTSKPLLANDPHLGARAPSIWYLAHLTGGELDVIGATLPGIPGVIIGHNARIAWGVTNTGPDVQDLFVEHINARDQVEHNGQWEPMQIIPEVIDVKGQPPITMRARVTRHGPLISDVVGDASAALAFRWTALDDEDHTLESFLKLNTAQNWDDFTAALATYHAPMQNFVYADVDGNIGYYAPGALPRRASGDGTVPAPGWTDEHDWTGYVPFAELPHTYNPPRGYIVSANNRVLDQSYPYLIGTDWAPPYRAQRIVEMIEARPKLSPDDVAAMQADVQSSQARELLPFLRQVTPEDDLSRTALDLLKTWDGTVRGDSAAAAVYEAWYAEIPKRIFADELGDEVWNDYADQTSAIAIALPVALRDPDAHWCDDVTTSKPEDCSTVLADALADGLKQMAEHQGSNKPASWRWDHVHHAMFPHNPFDEVGLLKPIFSRQIANGGDGATVDVAPVRASDLYNQYHVPSYRQIVDLSDLDASRFIHTLGQSGQLLSPDYSSFLERWQRVEYLPMYFTRKALDSVSLRHLELQPGSND